MSTTEGAGRPDPFPTRRYPYRKDVADDDDGSSEQLTPNVIHRFIVGLDAERPPKAMASEASALLGDPFAELLRSSSRHPVTARMLVEALDATGLERESYVVSDGGQIPWTEDTSHIARQTRLIVLWRRANDTVVMLATSPLLEDANTFLQVIGWDSERLVFNFYERGGGAWVWAGNSHHALKEPTRLKGPFDSHVNGGLVMKELSVPWLHWSSQSARNLPGIAPEDSLRTEPLFVERQGAEDLELRVRSAIRRWTGTRFKGAVKGETFVDVPSFVRHVLTTTTVNIASSAQESRVRPSDDRLLLPVNFFIDAEGLLDVLGVDADLFVPHATWDLYQRGLREHGYSLRDEHNQLAAHGDTHFAFPVPERSFEDQAVVSRLTRGATPLLEPRVAACLLMVDFPNPVFSARRSHLMGYVPESARLIEGRWTLGPRLVEAIMDASSGGEPTSPEAEFASHWEAGDAWRAVLGAKLAAYLQAVQTKLDSWEGFEPVLRLAESRRRQLRKRKLHEFRLTTPVTNLPSTMAVLQMHEDGTVSTTPN